MRICDLAVGGKGEGVVPTACEGVVESSRGGDPLFWLLESWCSRGGQIVDQISLEAVPPVNAGVVKVRTNLWLPLPLVGDKVVCLVVYIHSILS